MSERSAVLLLAHGTPDALDEIPEYLRNVTERTASAGERSRRDSPPLFAHRHKPADQTDARTGTAAVTGALPSRVYVGMRNWKPYIADVVQQDARGWHRQKSSRSVSRRRIRAPAWDSIAAPSSPRRLGMQVDFVEGWADHPLLADAFAERLRAVFDPFSAETGQPVPVLFTAHSVPCRTIQTPSAERSNANAERSDPDLIRSKRSARRRLVAERMTWSHSR